jgi:hypothetical protein
LKIYIQREVATIPRKIIMWAFVFNNVYGTLVPKPSHKHEFQEIRFAILKIIILYNLYFCIQ